MSSGNLKIEIPGEDRSVGLPDSGRLVIGTDPERADLVLAGQGIAAVHCAIGRVKGGGWALRDLGSDYGSLVNGRPVTAARLVHGDVIVLGSKRLRVVDPSLPVQPVEDPPTTGAEPAEDSAASPEEAPAPDKAPVIEPIPASRAGSRKDSNIPIIPGYRLERLLGRGGMGQVWLATQVSLDRRVAIKLLSAGLEADSAFVERFQAEARAAAALGHPNVVTVHDVGEAGGHHFLTMEYMAAGCLESRLQSLGPVPWREALTILRDAARGLEYAESKGVVHRDIKPANIMQTEAGITKIADLGLAVSVEQEQSAAAGRKIYGTPHFIAPELVRGERADARSDLYSLGATAYRILSGHTPFEAADNKDLLRQVLHEPVTPLREFDPALPEGVDHLIERLLAKDPAERPPSASVLLRELERLLGADGRQPDETPEAAPSKRTPMVVSLVVLVALAFGVIALMNSPETDPAGPGSGDPGAVAGVDENPTTGTPEQSDPAREMPGGGQNPGDTNPQVSPEQQPDTGDQNEQLVELAAENAFLKLRDLNLQDTERVTELRKIAERFLGTDTARSCLEQAQALEERLAAEAEASRQLDARRETLLTAMREAASMDGTRPLPGPALRAMAVVPGQEEWSGDEPFQSARVALELAVLEQALVWGENEWRLAQEYEAEGRFSDLTLALAQILLLTDLPSFGGEVPEAARSLLALGEFAREKQGSMGGMESRFLRERALRDRLALVAALGHGSGTRAELLAMDFAGAEARLTRLEEALTSENARERLAPHLESIRAGLKALSLLAETWRAGEWKRQSILDPRGGRHNPEATGADAFGIQVASDAGTEHIPWSAWRANVRAIDNLFTGRLNRPWTPSELGNIAHLMMVVGTCNTLAQVEGALDSSETFGTSLSQGRADAIAAGFEPALEWVRKWAEEGGSADLVEAVQAEEAAALALADALSAAGDERWSEAVASMEHLLSNYGDTLLVLLLSKGTEWEAPSQDPEGLAPADPAPGAGDASENSGF